MESKLARSRASLRKGFRWQSEYDKCLLPPLPLTSRTKTRLLEPWPQHLNSLLQLHTLNIPITDKQFLARLNRPLSIEPHCRTATIPSILNIRLTAVIEQRQQGRNLINKASGRMRGACFVVRYARPDAVQNHGVEVRVGEDIYTKLF